MTWWATRWGPGTSPDSFGYLSAAVSLAEAGRVDTVTGEPLTQFPPGYPAVLRIVMLTGVSPLSAARLVGIVAAGLLVLVASVLARRTLDSPIARCAVIATAVVAPGLAQIHRMAWTEPLYSVVVLLVLVSLVDLEASGEPPTRTRLLGLAGLTSTAVLLRYAGVGLVPGIALALALLGRRRRPWAREVVVYVVAACVVPAVWFARNLAVSGDIGGPPLPPVESLFLDLRSLLETVGGGVLPVVDAGGWLSVVVGLLLSARLSWVAIGSRMLAPLVVPTVLLAAIGVDRRGTIAADRRRSRRIRLAATAVGVVVLAGWILDAVDTTAAAHRDGIGGRSEFWRRAALVADLASIPPDGVVVSNEPGPVWAVTGRPAVGAIGTRGEIVMEDCRDPVHLVWMLTARWAGTEPPVASEVIVDRPRWSISRLPAGACDR